MWCFDVVICNAKGRWNNAFPRAWWCSDHGRKVSEWILAWCSCTENLAISVWWAYVCWNAGLGTARHAWRGGTSREMSGQRKTFALQLHVEVARHALAWLSRTQAGACHGVCSSSASDFVCCSGQWVLTGGGWVGRVAAADAAAWIQEALCGVTARDEWDGSGQVAQDCGCFAGLRGSAGEGRFCVVGDDQIAFFGWCEGIWYGLFENYWRDCNATAKRVVAVVRSSAGAWGGFAGVCQLCFSECDCNGDAAAPGDSRNLWWLVRPGKHVGDGNSVSFFLQSFERWHGV